jgi:GNAT superfamily N-acetyltransferase
MTGDPKLLEELELCEMAAWGDFCRAASEDSVRDVGLSVTEPHEALALIASAADVLALNHVLGLGLTRPAPDSAADELIELFTAAGVPRFFVQLSPGARPAELPRRLGERGFRHHNNWVKLCRDTSPPPPVSSDLTVRQIDERDAADFGRIVAECFNWPEATQRWLAELVGRPGWRHYMAFDGDAPAATGALYVWGDYAWVDFATTLPQFRKRGAQSAILAQRVRDAAELGCSQVVVETAEDTPQRNAPSYRNMLSFGFREVYVRPNYIYVTQV